MVIKPLEEDSTPGTAKPFQVSLVEPVAYQFQLRWRKRRLSPSFKSKTELLRGNAAAGGFALGLDLLRLQGLLHPVVGGFDVLLVLVGVVVQVGALADEEVLVRH